MSEVNTGYIEERSPLSLLNPDTYLHNLAALPSSPPPLSPASLADSVDDHCSLLESPLPTKEPWFDFLITDLAAVAMGAFGVLPDLDALVHDAERKSELSAESRRPEEEVVKSEDVGVLTTDGGVRLEGAVEWRDDGAPLTDGADAAAAGEVFQPSLPTPLAASVYLASSWASTFPLDLDGVDELSSVDELMETASAPPASSPEFAASPEFPTTLLLESPLFSLLSSPLLSSPLLSSPEMALGDWPLFDADTAFEPAALFDPLPDALPQEPVQQSAAPAPKSIRRTTPKVKRPRPAAPYPSPPSPASTTSPSSPSIGAEDRPFPCTFAGCDRHFRREWNMKSHYKLHFPSSRPFECDVCGRAFARKWDSTRHRRIRHADAPELAEEEVV
ncbi:hypothetical protein BDK51DRAFT_50083 [Blyttiomyces helicus]|uniref:C2H2-type domain-containing protein n=1 Tax=Blyttiomyces helicus TaxID=388810 RepID=A0A4P9WCU8_9FUNG|nr:hypothetical protein BDK51DRAFT_50083 [Blyttiomyces helicus]|eukprot:RKO89048.1 hypothetical protein BDK51DRAFT_50083 [Blyttiomyces helicus]